METTLHFLLSRVEGSMHVKKYALTIFLDIEGAFNNVEPDAVVRALDPLNQAQDNNHVLSDNDF